MAGDSVIKSRLTDLFETGTLKNGVEGLRVERRRCGGLSSAGGLTRDWRLKY